MTVRLKRVYEVPSASDGARVLVDRLWPRGLTKEAAALDVWLKDVAPSHELRKWYHEHPSQWAKFRKQYLGELDQRCGPCSAAETARLRCQEARAYAVVCVQEPGAESRPGSEATGGRREEAAHWFGACKGGGRTRTCSAPPLASFRHDLLHNPVDGIDGLFVRQIVVVAENGKCHGAATCRSGVSGE